MMQFCVRWLLFHFHPFFDRPTRTKLKDNFPMKEVKTAGYELLEPLKPQQKESLQPKHDEVVIRVAAIGVNRNDKLKRPWFKQSSGLNLYPANECSGIVEKVGWNVTKWKAGDQVCALLDGGCCSDEVVVPAGQVLPVPSNVSLVDAASLPLVACNVWSALFTIDELRAGESLLIHEECGEVGLFAIKLAKLKGLRVYVVAGSSEKLAACKNLGADVCINRKKHDFSNFVCTELGGVDVIMDTGVLDLNQNILCLTFRGRVIMVESQEFPYGWKKIFLGHMIPMNIEFRAVDVSTRDTDYKCFIVDEVTRNVWPFVEEGKLQTVVYKTFPLPKAAEALKHVRKAKHSGKILLIPSDSDIPKSEEVNGGNNFVSSSINYLRKKFS